MADREKDRKRQSEDERDERSKGQFGGLRGDLGYGAGKDIEEAVEDEGRPASDVVDRKEREKDR